MAVRLQSSHIWCSIEGKAYVFIMAVRLQSSHICYSIEGKTCMYLSWQLGYRVVIFGPLLKGRHVCIYHGS